MDMLTLTRPLGGGAVDLLGPRTIIRPYSPSDALAVWEAIEESRASLARWTPDIARRATVGEVRTGLAQVCAARARGQRLIYGIWRRADWRLLGEVGLHDVDWARQTGTVGYWLRLSARGQGFVREAVDVLQAHARASLGLRRLEAHIAEENHASRRVVERLGYLLTGQRPADPEWDGDTRTMLIYARTLGGAHAV